MVARTTAPARTAPSGVCSVSVAPPPDPRALRDHISSDLTSLFYALAGICLLIGTVGIANTTLVAVMERSAEIGLRRALDRGAYQRTKQPFSFEFLPTYCHRLARMIAATRGRVRKCVVLDLDDTLWGGTVGEDGAAALAIGLAVPADNNARTPRMLRTPRSGS